jgi:hypothetical protein
VTIGLVGYQYSLEIDLAMYLHDDGIEEGMIKGQNED